MTMRREAPAEKGWVGGTWGPDGRWGHIQTLGSLSSDFSLQEENNHPLNTLRGLGCFSQ